MIGTGPAAEYVARQAAARWRRTRAGGRSVFVWRYGVVGWGLPAGMLAAVYHVVRVHAAAHAGSLAGSLAGSWSPAVLRPLWASIAGLVIVCGVVGYLLGAWLWDYCEATFTR